MRRLVRQVVQHRRETLRTRDLVRGAPGQRRGLERIGHAYEPLLGQPVDLCRGRLATGEDAEVDADDDLRLFGPHLVGESDLRLTFSAFPRS